MSVPNKSETTALDDALNAEANYPSNTFIRGGGGLPRITILTADFEAVEPVSRWLQRFGYPLSWSRYEVVDGVPVTLEPADVVIFHTTAPDSDLPSVAEMLQRQYERRKPVVILLTTRKMIGYVDVTVGFDDFVTTPFDPQEVETRIKFSVWRRHGVQVNDMIICGDLTIDLGNYEVTACGESVDLTLKEYELLKYLATRRGRAFTREHLLTKVWGYDYFGGTRTVDVHIRRLRMKIERHGLRFIHTIRGVGYKFGE